jgi:hypothetical protein
LPASAEEPEDMYNDIKDDSSIVVTYDISSSTQNGNTVYEYEIIITNTSSQSKTNLVGYDLLPPGQLPYADFIGASVPSIQANLDTGAIYIPSLSGNQSISVFVNVTLPG